MLDSIYAPKIFLYVITSTIPVAGNLDFFWKSFTALSVPGPNSPSAVNPSACWTFFTEEPLEPILNGLNSFLAVGAGATGFEGFAGASDDPTFERV